MVSIRSNITRPVTQQWVFFYLDTDNLQSTNIISQLDFGIFFFNLYFLLHFFWPSIIIYKTILGRWAIFWELRWVFVWYHRVYTIHSSFGFPFHSSKTPNFKLLINNSLLRLNFQRSILIFEMLELFEKCYICI